MRVKQQPKFLIISFFLIGMYLCIIGTFSIKVEIIPTGTEIQAQIHKKSNIPPFKNIDIIIPNLKQALVTTTKDSKGRTEYRTELEDYQGHRYPVTSYYGSAYYANATLQKQINSSIKNKITFTNSISQKKFMGMGTILLFVSLVWSMANKKATNTTQQQSRPHPYQVPEKMPEEFQTESEEEKYKNINDSIIK